MGNKIHFDAQGKGFWQPGAAECGAGQGRQNNVQVFISTDPQDVSCKRCMKTVAFKEATISAS